MSLAQAFYHVTLAGLTGSSLVATYPILAGEDKEAILQFYNYDHKWERARLNETATGPQGSPFDASPIIYKYDIIGNGPQRCSRPHQRICPRGHVRRFGWSKDRYMGARRPRKFRKFLASLSHSADLYLQLAIQHRARTPTRGERHRPLSKQNSSSRGGKIKVGKEFSKFVSLVVNVERVVYLPVKLLSRLPDSLRDLANNKSVRYDPSAMLRLLEWSRDRYPDPSHSPTSDEELIALADLLKQMLVHDPKERIEAEQILQSIYLTQD